MADVKVAQPGLIQSGGDALAMYLKVFAGEVITAFERSSVTMNRHIVRTIQNGKSAQFPIFGRAKAGYLKPGKNLDDLRENIPGNEKLINIDGLLTTSQLITDIDEAMSHFDVRGEYSRQMGEALALSADAAVIAEVAKLVVANTANITGAQGTGVGKIITRSLPTASVGITEATGKMIVDILLEAKAAMSRNYVPKTDRVCYLDPDYHAALISSLVAINRDYGAVGSIVEGDVLRIAGFDIVEVPYLTDGGADAVNVLQGAGHIFPATYAAKKPLVICHRTAVGTVKLKDLSIERARRAEFQADMLVAKYAMGHGGLRPEASFMGVINAV